MLTKLQISLVVIIGIAFSFLYGTQFDRYHIFPYDQITTIKQFLSKSTPSLSSVNLQRAEFFATFSRKADVVMVGDSHTDYAEWSEVFPTTSIVNRGIAGDTTAGILQRMDSIYAVHAKKAFILVGINDLSQSQTVESVLENYSIIASHLQQRGVQVYIQSTILCNTKLAPSQFHCGENLSKLIALNSELEQLAKQRHYVYIDINKGLIKNGELNLSNTWDGVHLNSSGYKIWKNTIQQFVNNSSSN